MKIAIIGGIGSGKSVALNVAKELNIATLSCDEINANLLQNETYLNKLNNLFPSAFKDNILDKKELSNIIYNSNDARGKLNALAHPIIFDTIYKDKRSPLVVEIPLFNSEIKKNFDEVILIKTSKVKRLELLKINRGMDENLSSKIMSTQASEEELNRLSTIVVENDSTLDELKKKIENILRTIIVLEK